MKKQFELIATAAAGIEAVVGRELRDLGYDCQVENGRVRFQGDRRAIIETNLWLRAADRVKIVVGSFPAKTFEELFQGVFALDWENYLPLGARFPISKAKCVKSKPFRKKQWLKSYKNTMPDQKVFLSWKMGQSSRSKYRSLKTKQPS